MNHQKVFEQIFDLYDLSTEIELQLALLQNPIDVIISSSNLPKHAKAKIPEVRVYNVLQEITRTSSCSSKPCRCRFLNVLFVK